MKFKKFSTAVLAFTILFTFGTFIVSAQMQGVGPTGATGNETPPGGTKVTGPTSPTGGTKVTGPSGGANQPLSFHLDNPLKSEYGNDIPSFLHGLLDKVILPLAEVIIVFMFIYTGFMFVVAQGNPGKIGDAKRSLLYTAIGTAILLGAWGLSLIIKETVNQVITL